MTHIWQIVQPYVIQWYTIVALLQVLVKYLLFEHIPNLFLVASGQWLPGISYTVCQNAACCEWTGCSSIPSHSIYHHHRLNPLPSIQGFQRKNHIGIFLPRVFLGGGRVRAAFGPCGFTPEGPQENMNRDDLWGTVMNCELVNLSELYQIIHNVYIYIYLSLSAA